MTSRIVASIISARWLLLALLLVLAVLAGLGQGRLGFSTDYRVYLSHDNPELMALEEMQATYDKSDNLLIVLAPRSGDVFSRESLEALQWLTHEAWQAPYSVRVESLTNFQDMQSSEDAIKVADLVENAAQMSDARRARVKEIALGEPQLVNRLVAPDGRVAAVNVIYHLPGLSPFENSEVVGFARGLAEKTALRFPDMQVHLTGMAMYNNAFFEAAISDEANLTPIVYLVIALSALVLLRSVLATLAVVAIVYLSVTSAVGIAGWLGMSLTSLSASAPLVILMIGVADAVHLLSAVLLRLRRGVVKAQAVRESLNETFVPIAATSASTIVAFLSLNFSEVPPFRDLGNMVAIGIALAWVFTVFLLPGLIFLLPLRARAGAGDISEHLMGRFGGWVSLRAIRLLWIGLPLALVLALLSGRNELNDQYLKWFHPDTAFRQANDFTEQNLTGLYAIEYSLRSHSPSGVAAPAFLTDVDAYTRWLRRQPEVAHVASLADTVKRINRSLHGGADSEYRIPDDSALAAQSLLLYEQSLPYGLDLNNQIDVNKEATRVVVSLHELSTAAMLEFEQRSMDWLAQNTRTLEAKAASTTLIFAHIGQRNIESMISGILLCAGIVALLLMAVFRSWKLGLLSLIPNLLPAAVAFGIWSLFVGQIGFSVAIVASMTLGIVVDDTIHIMYAVLRSVREERRSVGESIQLAFRSAGPALLVTSVALIAGFLVMATSQFALNREMGLVTALTLFIALLADFFLLPGLLKKTMENSHAEEREPLAVPGDAAVRR
ncbi:efflux RND transporter permease subunit [Pseudomonas sp. NCHU5208]|uniref:efflux RND transporter permease subunit n=1 Tax=unclassified Pseudomonas TaxID=196821 RepID=UPI003F9DE38C